MELGDAGRRILGQYWRLILCCMVAGALVAVVATIGEPTYTASTRIVLDTPDPSTRAASAAIADTVEAIARSPSQVRAALDSIDVDRDAIEVADRRVSVSGLGSSAIVELSVTDGDAKVAAALANALSARVIATRKQVTSGSLDEELAALDERIVDVGERIARADATIDALNARLAAAGATESASDVRADRDAAVRERESLAQQRGVLESERVGIIGASAARPQPAIISRAAPPRDADPSRWLSFAILGGLMGLILGIGVAALAEVVRPTVVGGGALARELDAPLLGALRRQATAVDSEELATIAARVGLAADAAGATEILLLPLAPDTDVGPLADALRPALNGTGARDRDLGPSHLHVRAGDPWARAPITNAETTAVVVVSPDAVKRADLVNAGSLLRLTPAPIIGLVTHARAPSRLLHTIFRRRR